MAMENLRKTAGKRSSGQKMPAENIVVQINDYSGIEKIGKPNDKDTVRGVLLADALGKKGGEEVVVRLRPSNVATRRSIAQLPYKQNTMKKVKEGGIVEFQNCWIDRQSGEVTAGWLKPLVHDKDAGVTIDENGNRVGRPEEHAFAGVMGTVYQARSYQDGSMRQDAVLIDTANATAFLTDESLTDAELFGPEYADLTPVDKFKAVAAKVLEPMGPGNPGFIIRVTDASADPNDQENRSRFAMMVVRRMEKIAENHFEFEPIEKTLDRMANDPKDKMQMGAAFLADLQNPDPNAIWEIIPVTKIRIGSASLPQHGKDESGKDKVKDMSGPFSFASGKDRVRSLYTTMNAAIKLNENTGAYALIHAMPTHVRFGADNTFVREEAKFFTLSDIPTANLPSNHLEAIMAAAAERAKGVEKAPAAEDNSYVETDHEEEAKGPAPR